MQRRVMVKAGAHDRWRCPVCFDIGGKLESATLTESGTGREVPCQCDETRLSWILDELPAGAERAYVLADGHPKPTTGVSVKEKSGAMDVMLGDDLFATYHFEPDMARPFLNPVIGPTGVSVLRELFESGGGKDHDHIHHRGALVAHGDVNGVDNWSEADGHGRQVHAGTEATVSGPVSARIAVANNWVSADGDHLLAEHRTMTFWNIRDDVRVIDFNVRFHADAQDVVFGDTKEGGILSVRLATSLRVDRGGHMVNAYGGIDEGECWGKRAHWCDCFGTLDGREVGVAVFDALTSFRHPTYWHIRNYGLFAANPFALADYYGDKSRDGSHTLARGDQLVFDYRLYLHRGDPQEGKVAEAYHGFVNPPKVVEDDK